MNPNENLSHQQWLQSQETQKQIKRLVELKITRLEQASRAAKSPEINPLQLQLLLREASVIEEVINFLSVNN